MVVEIAGKPGTVAFKLGLRHRERRPRRQVLHRACSPQHVPVHEKKVDARPVTVFARAARIALLVTLTGLPANTAQRIALVLGQLMPSVTRGMPQLVKQTMLRRHQPLQ